MTRDRRQLGKLPSLNLAEAAVGNNETHGDFGVDRTPMHIVDFEEAAQSVKPTQWNAQAYASYRSEYGSNFDQYRNGRSNSVDGGRTEQGGMGHGSGRNSGVGETGVYYSYVDSSGKFNSGRNQHRDGGMQESDEIDDEGEEEENRVGHSEWREEEKEEGDNDEHSEHDREYEERDFEEDDDDDDDED